jgi:hypothetical protein
MEKTIMKKVLVSFGAAIAMALALTWGSSPADAGAQDASCLAACVTKALACVEAAGEDSAKVMDCAVKQAACLESC